MESPCLAVRLRVGEHGIPAPGFGEIASLAESAGAEALFVSGDREGGGANDPFVLLGAATSRTSRIRLGCLSTPIEERHPSILAKTLTSLDVCSGGRAIACVAANFAEGADPAGTLVEGVSILRAMFELPAPSFHGEHFSITEAWNEPRVLRDRPIPIGVAIDSRSTNDHSDAVQAAQIAVALLEHVDFVVTDWHPGTTEVLIPGTPVLAIIVTSSLGDVDAAVASAVHAGCAGVVLDFLEVPKPDALARTLAFARDAIGRFTQAGD
ncbi:MAG: LLM class flavin-dependent oxidoreductase [Acidimicrobiales bacterium]